MATSQPHLERFPAEILCHVYAQLDLESALSLSKTSLVLAHVFKENWGAILFSILERDFSPLESLLGVPVVLPEQFNSPYCAWLRPRIYFSGRLVSEEDIKGLLPQVSYRREHVRSLLGICKVVKAWEAAFPRLRFSQRAQFARSLHGHENERLRGALYNWWRYAMLFHHDAHRTDYWVRDSRMPDMRCNNLRTLSTAQLYELQDLWETVRSAVATDLCPSVPLVLHNAGKSLSRTEAARLGWGHSVENDTIVSTVMRLVPDQMLHFLESRHVYATKKSLITAIRFLRPSIENHVESLTGTLHSVIRERRELLKMEVGQRALKRKRYFPARSFPKPHGGILDYQAQRWQKVRVKYGNDGGKGLGLDAYGPHISMAFPYLHRLMPAGLLEPSQ